jgi:tRNA U34 5-methylaminomethyl-2-thiouridine-forming methyltransferase MnmC
MKENQLIITEDGSHTLFVADLNEHYHSIHGAVTESMHVFIEAGLKPLLEKKKNINVLEIGIGTGLNAALVLLEAENNDAIINYVGAEPYPLSLSLVSQLNYFSIYGGVQMHKAVMNIHSCNRNLPVEIGNHFIMNYLEAPIQNIDLKDSYFDLVFFDAFSPTTQPELWTAEIFAKIFKAMKPNGVLVTYVAKGEVRRTMKACGFTIEKLTGFAGKREMTRANKPSTSTE